MNKNVEHIQNSLDTLQTVFNGLSDYRVVGSILVAAINGKPHRELHDIDLLIDRKIYDEVAKRFLELGFSRLTKHAGGFTWDEFQKKNHLTFGVLLRGSFKNKYFEYKANNVITLLINNQYLTATEYKLFGKKVQGIPIRSVYEGIKIANLNKKRLVDKKIVLEKTSGKFSKGLSLNQAFHIRLAGLEVPYLYTIFSQVYNLIGGIRLAMGKPYDTWS